MKIFDYLRSFICSIIQNYRFEFKFFLENFYSRLNCKRFVYLITQLLDENDKNIF